MKIFIYFVFLVLCFLWFSKKKIPSSKLASGYFQSGAELDNWIKNFEWGHKLSNQDHMRLPQYKFYSGLAELILNFSRKYGGKYQNGFFILREGLRLDLQFEKRIKEIQIGSYVQMGLILLITWCFVFVITFSSKIIVGGMSFVLVFSWQTIGLFQIPVWLKILRKRYFEDIGNFWKILFSLQSLSQVPISRSEAFRLCEVSTLDQIHQQGLSHLREKLKKTCEDTLKKGVSYEQEVKSMMEELRFIEKWHFELFEKKIGILKLVVLSVFFLPSYLVFIFFILQHLMRLM